MSKEYDVYLKEHRAGVIESFRRRVFYEIT